MRRTIQRFIIFTAIFALIRVQVLAVIAPATFYEVRPTVGDDTQGGGFSIGIGSSTNLTTGTLSASSGTHYNILCDSTHGTFAADLLKYIKITSAGTGGPATQGAYQIIAVTTNGCSAGVSSATLDRDAAAASTTSLNYTLYPGIDRSQQTSAQVVIDNAAITATCSTNTVTFTGSTYTPVAADQGNIVQLISGSGGTGSITAGLYEISGFTSTTWTITGAATACGTTNQITSAKMGGAFASLTPLAAGVLVAGNRAYVKATGTLSMASGLTFSSAAATPVRVIGYTSTRGDNGVVLVQPSTSGLTLFTISGSGNEFENLHLDGSNGANTIATGFNLTGANNSIENSQVNNFTVAGITMAQLNETAVGNTINAGQSGCTAAINVSSSNSTGESIRNNNLNGNACTEAIAAGNASASAFIGFNLIYNNGANIGIQVGSGWTAMNNTIDGMSVAIEGVAASLKSVPILRNNLLSNNTTGLEMWTSAGTPANALIDGNCYYNNTTNRTNSDDEGSTNLYNAYPYRNSLDQVLGSSPYVDDTHTGGNFAIKNTSGAYQTGTPGAMPGVSQLGYMSCGALVPQGPSGASGAVVSNAVISNSVIK